MSNENNKQSNYPLSDNIYNDNGYERDKKSHIAEVTAASVTALNEQGKTSAVTQEYKRSNYEDKAAMERYKDTVYNEDGTAKDRYSDNTIYRSHKQAEEIYGEDAKYHKGETDHTFSEHEAHSLGKNMTYLNDEDVKTAVNRQHNFKETNKSTNTSKSDSSKNSEKNKNMSKKDKAKMAVDKAVATTLVSGELLAKDLGRVAIYSAKSGAVSGAERAAGKNIAAVLNGEKDLSDAIVDTAVDSAKATATSAVTGVGVEGTKIAVKTVSEKLATAASKKAASEALTKATEGAVKVLDGIANNVGVIVTATVSLTNAIKRYADGEIDSQELLLEMGQTGSDISASALGGTVGAFAGGAIGGFFGTIALPGGGTVSGAAIGAAVGEVVGNIIGYVVSTLLYPVVTEVIKSSKIARERAEEIHRICEISIRRANAERAELEHAAAIFFAKRDSHINTALDIINKAMLSNDVEGFSNGMNLITKEFGGNVQFNSFDEFYDIVTDKSKPFVF